MSRCDDPAAAASRERLNLMYEAAQRLILNEDPASFLQDLYTRLAAHLGLDVYVHFCADDEARRLELVAYSGIPEEMAARMKRLAYGQGICGAVALSRQPKIVDHVQHSAEPELSWLREVGVKAYACHPLLSGDRLMGTLSFGTRHGEAFSPDAVTLMASISDQLAVALDRWRTRCQLQTVNEMLERRVAERTAELEQRTEELRRLADHLTHAEARERRRLAELLHDHLQQLIVAARFKADLLIRKGADPEVRRLCEHMMKMLDEAVAATRTLAAELHPAILHNEGLGPALRWLGRQMAQQHELQVEVAAPPDAEPASEDARVVLFHAVREVLFNVVKHAGVGRATVDLRRDGDQVTVIVRDEGRGFDPHRAERHDRGGFGLCHLRDRLRLAGGSLNIDTAPGRGTRVELRISDQHQPAPSPVQG